MSLTISQLIKIILGMLVVIVVILGIYSFFRNSLFEFLKNVFKEILILFIGDL